MTRKTRKLILCFLILGFLLAGAGFLLYSLGWSLDQKTDGSFTFKKTGAVFLKVQPADALVEINGKTYVGKPGFFGNSGELIKGFLPSEYEVKISKDGFYGWRKKLTVQAGLIASASSVYLFPEKIAGEPVLKTEAEKFWLTPAKKQEIQTIFYSLKQKQLKLPGKPPIIQLLAYPFDTTKAAIATAKNVYLLDRQNFSLGILTSSSTKFMAVSDSELALLGQDETIQIYNLDSRQLVEKIILELTNEPEKIAFSKSNKLIGLLTDKGELFVYNRNSKELKKFGEKIKDFRFSPDAKKIAALNQNGNIEIIFLEDYQRDFKMAGGQNFKIKNVMPDAIVNFNWLPKIIDHLIVQYPGKTIAVEVDNRKPQNSALLGEDTKDFAFDSENNLYFLQNGQFLKITL